MEQNTLVAANPRIGVNADKDGNYLLSPSLTNHITNPGENIKLKIFISGYGMIDSCKLHVSYPDDIIEYSKSQVRHSLGKNERDVGHNLVELEFFFGAEVQPLTESGILIDLATGLTSPTWTQKTETCFFDTNERTTPLIATEKQMIHAPLEFTFLISPKAKAGNYNVYLIMTYFNGNEWKGDRLEIPITVTSLFQRNELLFTTLAIWLAAISTVSAVVDTFINHYVVILEIVFNFILPLFLMIIVWNLIYKRPPFTFPMFKTK